ncbi:MAG: hypothetical protein ABIH83_00415 [Candidatus Micrarchaeota archaeon]
MKAKTVQKDGLTITKNAFSIIKQLRLREIRFCKAKNLRMHEMGERAYYQKLCDFAEENWDTEKIVKYGGNAKLAELIGKKLSAACKNDDLESIRGIIDNVDLFTPYKYTKNLFNLIWTDFPIKIIDYLFQKKKISLGYRIGKNNVTIFHGIALKYQEKTVGTNMMPQETKDYAKKLTKTVGAKFLNKLDSEGKTALDYAGSLRSHKQMDVGRLIADNPMSDIDTYDPLDFVSIGPPSYNNYEYYTILKEAGAKHSNELK